MSSTTARRSWSGSISDEVVVLWVGLVLVLLALGVTWTSLHLATTLAGAPAAPSNPVALAVGLRPGGDTTWPSTSHDVAQVAKAHWELLRQDAVHDTPTWPREHLDHQLAVLLST